MSSLSANSNSVFEEDSSRWDQEWAETSLSTSEQQFHATSDFDDASSVQTTSTMPRSEYESMAQGSEEQPNAKVLTSILKK